MKSQEDHRDRLEHVFLPTTEAIQRMRELNVVVTPQPSALYTGGDFSTQLFGAERPQRFAPIRSFLNAGVPVALSTDWPTVVLLHPKYTLWSAVVRKTLTGRIVGSEERITIQEALRLHTMGSAYAAFEEDVKGSIEEGKYADMTIWSDDLYTMPVADILSLYTKGVVVGGIVYENPDLPCVGDCDQDGAATVDELLTGVRISLGLAPLDECAKVDANEDGQCKINELVRAVNNALYGCPQPDAGQVDEH